MVVSDVRRGPCATHLPRDHGRVLFALSHTCCKVVVRCPPVGDRSLCAHSTLQALTGITSLELSGLSGSQLPPAALLHRFERLQSISIAAPGAALAGFLPALQQLQQLTLLSLEQRYTNQQAELPAQGWASQLSALLPRLLGFHMDVGYQGSIEAAALRALQQAAQLTSLSLEQPYGQLDSAAEAELAPALVRMRHLAALSLKLPAVNQDVVGRIMQRTALTSLCLKSRSASLPELVSKLTTLSRLQSLELQEGIGWGGNWRPMASPWYTGCVATCWMDCIHTPHMRAEQCYGQVAVNAVLASYRYSTIPRHGVRFSSAADYPAPR